MEFIWMALVGVAAGTLSVLLGVGGGIIMVPAMVFLAKGSMAMKVATATSLAVIIPTAIIGTAQRAGEVNWRVAAILAVGAVVGSVIGKQISVGASDLLLKRLFAGLMIITAIRMLISSR